MPRSRGRGRRRQGARRFEQKAAARPIEQPTVQKTSSTTAPQTTQRQYPTQKIDTSFPHLKRDLITLSVVTAICTLLIFVFWAVLR